MLKNLLSNAFKFTEQGDVNMRVGLAGDGWSKANDSARARGGRDRVQPSATPASASHTEKQQLIFEAFAQGDGTTARQYGGTGLGLSISRELVRLLGGEITLASTPGAGQHLHPVSALAGRGRAPSRLRSTETAPWPAAAPGAACPMAPEPPVADTPWRARAPALNPLSPPDRPAGQAMAGLKVLVVDDDFHNIFALTALLKRVELEVVSAESGERGIAILEQTPDVDLVLVDIMMPGMDGYATMRAMRRLPAAESLPLVAFTAKVEDGERERCIDAGASAYIRKPVDAAELLLVLGEWLPAAPPTRRPATAAG